MQNLIKLMLVTAAVICASSAAAEETDRGAVCDLPILLRPADCPVIAAIAILPQTLRENHIFFPAGGAVLDAKARRQLTLLTSVFRDPLMAGTCLRLIGHSDPSGPSDINLSLARLRAETVKSYLTSEMGAFAPPMAVATKGEAQLIPNISKDSVAHRRVQIEARPCPTTSG